MTDPSPYQPVPLDIPAGHPLLDTGPIVDLRALGEAGPSGEQLAAALAVIKASGYSVAEATAAHDQAMAALRASRRQDGHRCDRCDAPATVQWPRRATDQEAEAWHTAREQHIRAHNDGRPEAAYVADRTDVVTLAVHGCDDHDLSPGPADDTNAAKYEARQLGADRRALLHEADCGGHGACQCGGQGA